VIYVHAEGQTTTKAEETTMKKTTWIVKAYTGYKTGWQEIKRFDNPADADNWLCRYVRENGYSITDFNIVRK
jgi:hypothetical protein